MEFARPAGVGIFQRTLPALPGSSLGPTHSGPVRSGGCCRSARGVRQAGAPEGAGVRSAFKLPTRP